MSLIRGTPSSHVAHALHHRPQASAVMKLSDDVPDEEIMDYDVELAVEEVPAPFDSLKLGGVIELGRLSPAVQFIILSLGMFVLYVVHAYFQEKIFSSPQFNSGFFVSLCDFLIFGTLAGVQLLVLEGRIPLNAPLKSFAGISVALAISIGMGFESLKFLNYPTKVLFKSGKIIPTMLMGKAFGKNYSLVEYVAAVFLCAGLAAFTLGQASVSPAFHVLGVALISVSALSEAAVGNLQEHILTRHRCVLLEIVFWSNLFSSAVVLAYILVSGQLMQGVEFVFGNADILQSIAAEAIVGYLGVFFYLGLVQRFGVAVCIGVSALRKIATICLSFLFFPKPFTMMYVYGAALVLGSILLTAYVKNTSKKVTVRVKTHYI